MFAEDELNEEQRVAALHGDGPLLVVAGAGTGKTRTLAARVAALVRRGVPAERILLLTFTRRAAREMLLRAERMAAGGGLSGRVWGGTFHAVANRLLRIHGRALGIPPSFTVLDQADAADVMDVVRQDLGLGSGRRRFPRKDTLADIHSRTVNSGSPLADVLRRDFPWCADRAEGIAAVFRAYTGRKRAEAVLDYDDLLLYWRALLDVPGVGEAVAGRFDHVLVDEYQDTNALQADVLVGMRRGCPNLTVVGDDAQSIYGFRSATVENILGFPARFPGTTVVRLERNYRSAQGILDVANAVMAAAPRGYGKSLRAARGPGRRPVLWTLVDDADQADRVCRQVLAHREEGTALREQAVLYRAAHHSDVLEVELSRRNIPFVKYGGLRFLEAAHVKDLLAVLRILENPRDGVSWFRVLQLGEGVGPATARRLLDDLRAGGADPLVALLESGPPGEGPAREGLAALAATLRDCLAPGVPVASQVERVGRFLAPAIRRVHRDPEPRLRDLEQLGRLAGGAPSRERFLTDLTLDPPVSTGDLAGPPHLDEDHLILSTIHSAKGCEWDVVHVIHAADGNIPSDMATGTEDGVEEERRLFYVALTRARQALHVYAPLRYYHRRAERSDAHSYGQLTRFVGPEVRALFDEPERLPDPSDDGVAAAALAGGGGAEAVDRYLDGLWGEPASGAGVRAGGPGRPPPG
ncbi:MAG: ATP-dependent helicase [Actinobacteria bacterium]|nr:ATP-dependent helicase [Actinomycetota bacterium]